MHAMTLGACARKRSADETESSDDSSERDARRIVVNRAGSPPGADDCDSDAVGEISDVSRAIGGDVASPTGRRTRLEEEELAGGSARPEDRAGGRVPQSASRVV